MKVFILRLIVKQRNTILYTSIQYLFQSGVTLFGEGGEKSLKKEDYQGVETMSIYAVRNSKL